MINISVHSFPTAEHRRRKKWESKKNIQMANSMIKNGKMGQNCKKEPFSNGCDPPFHCLLKREKIFSFHFSGEKVQKYEVKKIIKSIEAPHTAQTQKKRRKRKKKKNFTEVQRGAKS